MFRQIIEKKIHIWASDMKLFSVTISEEPIPKVTSSKSSGALQLQPEIIPPITVVIVPTASPTSEALRITLLCTEEIDMVISMEEVITREYTRYPGTRLNAIGPCSLTRHV